ncbi:hypothetical protein Riv7116_3632 [Rivularia sp. PCC 7116]|uniref:hypothetical protein n=1 Tax=Rivularia sp. PCC 7116 TaxID=373994 RepID=UPI00029EDB2D|nr:hypothetical protein [Rivularia sp. PCC 7116]AFY56082.1 hypothetical protein Riv7116_3632 [Rivularia sp. PCC 7116]
MANNITRSSLARYIFRPFSIARSKLFALNQSKPNQSYKELEDSQSEEYQIDTNLQQNLHPYLEDRVEPSVQHIIFSSYIKY